jgi:hypothetical protein
MFEYKTFLKIVHQTSAPLIIINCFVAPPLKRVSNQENQHQFTNIRTIMSLIWTIYQIDYRPPILRGVYLTPPDYYSFPEPLSRTLHVSQLSPDQGETAFSQEFRRNELRVVQITRIRKHIESKLFNILHNYKKHIWEFTEMGITSGANVSSLSRMKVSISCNKNIHYTKRQLLLCKYISILVHFKGGRKYLWGSVLEGRIQFKSLFQSETRLYKDYVQNLKME